MDRMRALPIPARLTTARLLDLTALAAGIWLGGALLFWSGWSASFWTRPEHVCLFLLGIVALRLLVARLHLRDWNQAHHTAQIIRYGGPEDLRMDAAIFQQARLDSLAASIWVEDGGWLSIDSAHVPVDLLARFDVRREGLPVRFETAGRTLLVLVADVPGGQVARLGPGA